MSLVNFFPEFFSWWYKRGLKDLFRFITAFFSYLFNFFSVQAVLKTFFSPWKRMVEVRRPGIDGWRDWMIDNLISRGVAVVMRFFLLIFFVVALVGFSLLSVFLIFFWLTMPAFLIFLFAYIWSF